MDAHRASVVYLTADSEEELIELKEGEIYVIGGICDHNRYKVCTLKKPHTLFGIPSQKSENGAGIILQRPHVRLP